MKNHKKIFASILAGILALIMLVTLIVTAFPVARVSAEKSATQIKTEIDELEKEKEALDKEIEELQAKVDANMSEIEQLVAQKAVTDQEIALLNDKMNNINEQLAVYNQMIAEKEVELQAAIERLDTLKTEYKERIRAMEENGDLSYWEVIFQANNFSDLLDRLNMIEEVDRADRQRLEELRQAAEVVEIAKADLEVKKESAEETKEELKETEVVLKEKQAESDAQLQVLLSKGQEYEDYIEQQEALVNELNEEIDERQGKLDEIEKAEYEKWLASQTPPANSNGSQTGSNVVNNTSWIVPINYTRFSSPYGVRIHPIYGTERMHYGVDLSAPSGTPIYAARSGVVYYRDWWGTGGNTVMINHQDGYCTRYLHMSSFAVENGQWVAAGQVIGYCGSTGDSTGPHLHFEILKDGSRVNPANYIYLG